MLDTQRNQNSLEGPDLLRGLPNHDAGATLDDEKQLVRGAVLAAMGSLKDFPGIFGPQNFDEKGDSLIKDIGIFKVRDGSFQFLKTATWD